MTFDISLDTIDQYIQFLSSKNPNIDWNIFINENIGRDEKYILKRLKSLLWIDKDLNYSTQYDNEYWFRYYTHLLNMYYDHTDKPLLILGLPNKIDNMPDILISIIESKLNVLERLLNMMNIEYKIINEYPSKDELFIPTSSILHPSLKYSIHNVIADGYYNICYAEQDEYINRFKIMVNLICIDSNIDIDELISCEYGMILCVSG